MIVPVLVEFLGTLLLIGTIAFAKSPLLTIAALSIAVTAGGKISGAHFNPAVSVYHAMAGNVSKIRALYYILAQVSAGAIIGLFSMI